MQKKSTKKQIVRAATKFFNSKGYTDTSISDVAGKCKITPAAIYHHVKNKEELLWLVYQQLIEELNEMVVKKVNKVDNPKDKLIVFIKCILNQWATMPEMAMLQQQPMQFLSRARVKEYNLELQKWNDFIEGFVDALMEKDSSPLEIEYVTATLTNIFSSQSKILSELSGKKKFKRHENKEQLFNIITKFYCQAILGEKFQN